MLKQVPNVDLLPGQQPRKRIKVNVAEDQCYNEFKGDFLEDPEGVHGEAKTISNQQKPAKQTNFEEESTRYRSIFQQVKGAQRKIRKINDVIGSNTVKQPLQAVKIEEEAPQKDKHNKKASKVQKLQPNISQPGPQPIAPSQSKPKQKQKTTGQSNWQQFMSKTSANTGHTTTEKGAVSKHSSSEAVAIDCEFVKSGDQQLLARISIVSEAGQCLFDSYVRPSAKITDFLTDITGVTYLHIKNAPNTQTVIEKAKKILYNKIVVGHTVNKDIEVCGLKEWKGWKALVDIAEFSDFKEKNGRLISLKNLSLRHLGRSIQEGRHSSVEDATATIDLYKLRRWQILKQSKVIM